MGMWYLLLLLCAFTPIGHSASLPEIFSVPRTWKPGQSASADSRNQAHSFFPNEEILAVVILKEELDAKVMGEVTKKLSIKSYEQLAEKKSDWNCFDKVGARQSYTIVCTDKNRMLMGSLSWKITAEGVNEAIQEMKQAVR